MNKLFIILCAALMAAKWTAQIWLEWLNQRHVRRNAGEVPPAFANMVTPETYAKSVDYTLAKSRFEMIELTWGAAVLAAVLFSGVLPWLHQVFRAAAGSSILVEAGFLTAVGVLLSAADLPFDWHAQFHLEERFGFNTTTARLWWMDRLKGLLLGLALGYPLLALILKLAGCLGNAWWFWAWVCLAAWQLVMMLAAPVLILPLFNKFTPLPPGELREGLLELGRRAGFRARDIQVMDGSKRSRHSNAFFTGLGRFRKIVLFDTLVRQLDRGELEAVLAHEIGHYKKGHVPKAVALSLGGGLLAFYLISALAGRAWFLGGFGFAPGEMAPALLLFALLSGVATFWLSPLWHGLSRRHEYEADAYAAGLTGRSRPLITALRKLNEKNLSNLTPHPVYSGFYYSHPTLLEREAALARIPDMSSTLPVDRPPRV
jgi:STE24 endopeptidase